MMTATNTRSQARESLANKWGKGALITLAYFIISYGLNYISSKFYYTSTKYINELIIFLVELPLSFGLIISFIRLKRNEDVKAFDFLSNFSENFKRAISITWNIILKMWIAIVAYIIAIILLGISAFTSFASVLSTASIGTTSIVLIIVGVVLLAFACVYGFIKGLLYSLSYYIAYDNPELSAKEAVEKSAELMNGNRGNIFVLQLSFIGWAILAAFTLGIGFLWLAPYVQVSNVCFYEEVAGINSVSTGSANNSEDTKTEEE